MSCLDTQTALVTGGSQGIGCGVALELASAGADIVITHLETPEDRDKAQRVTHEIQRRGRRAFAVVMDVADRASIKSGLSDALGQLGRIDILVNNAGVMQRGAGIETRSEDFERCYSVNLAGIWNTTQELLPHLRLRGGGKIINISSTAGRRGQPDTPAYCASKAAAISLTQSLAASLGPYGINVNAVCPGLVLTPMSRQWVNLVHKPGADEASSTEECFEAVRVALPLRRHVTVEDVGNAVVFLASSRAKSITGQAFNVDGGYTMS
jgi:meso-butanediol dehydrogenase/(S,S)-butanediol dehydrogenase/diacetyl reductase